MLESGYLPIGRWRGVPLRAHVLTPLGALVFTGFRFEPGAWLGFLAIVVLHEMGHALFVMRYGLRVAGIDLHAYGGLCRWSGSTTEWQRAVIAWGGVAAQALIFVLTWGVVSLLGAPSTDIGRQIVEVLTRTNLWLLAINLLPFGPFDGKEAWRVIPLARSRRSWPASEAEHRPAADDVSRTPVPVPTEISPEDARRIAKAFEDAVRKRP